MDANVVISDSGFSVKNLEIPATYYDRTGHMPLWQISKMYQNSTLKMYSTGFKDETIFPGERHLVVVATEKLQLNTKILRKMSRNKNIHYTVQQEFVASGKSTSVRKNSIFIDDGDNMNKCLLSEKYIKLIYISASSRRPMTLPDWFKAKYGQKSNPLANKMLIIIPPKNSFSINFNIGYSDTDLNLHLNAGEYYRILMDCATSASTSGYYHHFSLDMCWYPVREIETSFFGECFANDVLEIFTWQDKQNIEKLYFVFSLKKRYIFQAACIFDTAPYERNIESAL